MTEKQHRFVEAYLGPAAGNATEAARQAGYKNPRDAKRNAQNPAVASEITRKIATSATAGDIPEPEELLRILGDQARGSMGDFIDVSGNSAVINLLKAEQRGKLHLIKEIEVGKAGTKVKLLDQQRAAELLGKFYELWVDVTRDLSKTDTQDLIARAERIVENLKRVDSAGGDDG